MANSYFRFKQFTVHQERCAMKVTTDACLFGAWVAEEIKHSNEPSQHLLDIGTGTGLLPLMILQKNLQLHVDAIEIDPDACKQAEENSIASPWSKQLTIIASDIRNFQTDKLYDTLISNPPFYENELNAAHPKRNIAHHGSELTFNDLFDLINRHLNPAGTFYILTPYKRKAEIEKAMEVHHLHIAKEVYVRQSVNHDFFRIMLAGKKEKQADKQHSEISICNEKQQYTHEFVKYLQDYYLYL